MPETVIVRLLTFPLTNSVDTVTRSLVELALTSLLTLLGAPSTVIGKTEVAVLLSSSSITSSPCVTESGSTTLTFWYGSPQAVSIVDITSANMNTSAIGPLKIFFKSFIFPPLYFASIKNK